VGKPKSRTFVWQFDHPAPAIWAVMADTARFNEAAKLPKHEIEEVAGPDGSVRWTARMRRGPFRIEWEERPANWVFGRWFEHCRYFRNGPLEFLCASFSLEPSGTGCTGTYRIEAAAANPLGALMLATSFFTSASRNFGRLAANAREFAAGVRDQPFDYRPPPVAPATGRRVDAMVAAIEATANGHGLARRLADLVLTAQEVDLWHVRPLQLARDWGADELAIIELCLQAVRSGLLELRWDLLCPRCRVAKSWAASLDRLPTGAHCPSCNIDYEREFSRNVEASFRPSPAVRPIESGEFCLFGPMTTPHVKVHVTLEPGAVRDVPADLAPGRSRIRTLEPGPEETVEFAGGGFPAVIAGAETVLAGPPAPPGAVRLENASGRRLTLLVEDRAWLKDALTADRVTALQAFRDLFADQTLRPGDDVAIGRVTLMFTDLKGSTALYERIGDAAAYHLVREHFAFLAEVVRGHEGTVVKTIGDAVMAAFADPLRAVRAALAIQHKVAEFNAGQGAEGIVIKLGLHQGPCIAVTLNDRLDYFGSTVNLAARLQSESVGGDIVLSQALYDDADVAGLLAPHAPAADRASIKGFEAPVPFFRVTP